MKFIKFPSLDNILSTSSISRVENSGFGDRGVRWMATEKIHGANIGVYCDGENIEIASRYGILGEGDKLYNAKNVVNGMKDRLISYANEFLRFYKGCKHKPYIINYGELFGGSIQKNMPYPEEQDIIFFDSVLIFHKDDEGVVLDVHGDYKENISYVDDYIIVVPYSKLKFIEMLKLYGFRTPVVVATGTLHEMLELSNDFESNYTDNARVNNLKLGAEHRELRCKAEGLVLEPIMCGFNKQDRVYLKSRSPKFEEKKWEPKKDVTQMHLDTMSPKAVFVFQKLEEMVCENRFNSVISKIGEVSLKDFNKICGLMFQDVCVDFGKEELYDPDTDTFGKVDVYLDKAEFAIVKKITIHEIANCIRPLLLKM